MSKVCSKCKIEKELVEFNKDSKSKDLHTRWCRDCGKIANKIYRDNNKEYISTNYKKYYQENKEVLLEKKKVYNDNHKQETKEYGQKYRAEHKQEITTKKVAYKKEKYETDPLFKLKDVLRNRIRVCIKKESKSETILNIVGAPYDVIKIYIESQFTEGMTWENHGLYGWHIDHKVPISSAKSREEVIKLCHYTNLQPLWAEDNLQKSNKIITK